MSDSFKGTMLLVVSIALTVVLWVYRWPILHFLTALLKIVAIGLGIAAAIALLLLIIPYLPWIWVRSYEAFCAFRIWQERRKYRNNYWKNLSPAGRNAQRRLEDLQRKEEKIRHILEVVLADDSLPAVDISRRKWEQELRETHEKMQGVKIELDLYAKENVTRLGSRTLSEIDDSQQKAGRITKLLRRGRQAREDAREELRVGEVPLDEDAADS